MSGVTIDSKTYKGIFLYPDNYNGDIVSGSMTWKQINAAGIVFLPAAGSRYGSSVNDVGDGGSYWSSSDCYEGGAYNVYFNSSVEVVWSDNSGDRYSGCSVRLITECQ